jgi:hypothetical protein
VYNVREDVDNPRQRSGTRSVRPAGSGSGLRAITYYMYIVHTVLSLLANRCTITTPRGGITEYNIVVYARVNTIITVIYFVF